MQITLNYLKLFLAYLQRGEKCIYVAGSYTVGPSFSPLMLSSFIICMIGPTKLGLLLNNYY